MVAVPSRPDLRRLCLRLSWTSPINVAISSTVPKMSAQSPQALLIDSPWEMSPQIETSDDYPFAHEMPSTSTVRGATTASATIARSEHSKQTSEVAIPLEAKDPKRQWRPSKEQKKSRRSHQEKDLPVRRRDDNYSDGEGEGKANDGKRSGSRNGSRKEKLGSDPESSKAGRTRARRPKDQHSCTNGMGYKPPTVKSV